MTNTIPRATTSDAARLVHGYDLSTIKGRQSAKNDAEESALELAIQADHAARDAVGCVGDPDRVAVACGASAQAWAAVAALLAPNGAVP